MTDLAPSSAALSPAILQELQASVEAGELATVDEALQHAVARWARERREIADWRARIRADVQRALNNPEPAIDLDEAFDMIAAEILARMSPEERDAAA